MTNHELMQVGAMFSDDPFLMPDF